MKHISAYHKIVKSGSAFFVSSSIVSVLAYAFHIFAARFLSVSEYGTLQAVLSLQNIGLIPVVIIVALLTRVFAEQKRDHKKDNSILVRDYLRKITFFPGILIVIPLSLAIPFLQDFFHVTPFMVFVLLWVSLYLSVFQSIDNSLLNGWHRFTYSNLGTVSNGVSKFIIGVLCMAFGWGVIGGLIGVATGFLMNALLNAYSVRQHFGTSVTRKNIKNEHASVKGFKKHFMSAYPVIFGIMAITVFSNVDILIAKHHFSPEEAGKYGGIFVLSKIIFFAVSSLASVVIPLVSAEKTPQKKRQYLITILSVNTAIAGIGVLIFYFFPTLIIGLLFGSEYLSIAPYLAKFGFLALLLSLLNIFIQYCISMKINGILVGMMLLAVCEVFLLWLFGTTFDHFFVIMLTMLLAGNVFGCVSFFAIRK